MKGQKRPLSERTQAVGIALVDGVAAASRATGIPESTIHQWTELPEYEELRTKTPEKVTDMFWAAVQIGVDQVAQGLLKDAPLRDKAVALGILWDKHALMSGGATARTESRSLSDVLDDHERATLRSLIVGELADRETGSGDQGAGVDAGAASTPT